MSISKSIKINFTWSKELALKASKIYYDWDMRNSSKRYVGWLFVGLVQFGIVGALKHDTFGILTISTFLVGYWYYGRWYLRQKMISKFYDKQNIDNTNIVFEVNNDGFKTNDNVIDWDNIVKIIKVEDDILVQTTTNTLYFQRKSFDSYDDVRELLSLAKEHNKL